MPETKKLRIAIIGGGPSALFIYKRLVESEKKNFDIHVFERKNRLGAGMPYSEDGACAEHITNVSDNEIPTIVNTIEDWVKSEPAIALNFKVTPANFNEFKVLPRLLFGDYLSAQFQLLLERAKQQLIDTTLHLSVKVKDLIHEKERNKVWVITENRKLEFDLVVISIGHSWPIKLEGKVPGIYDSPYPPCKLNLKLNHVVAIKGSSLTAIDAIRTLSRNNGYFEKKANGKYTYKLDVGSEQFKLTMHSRSGLLPAVRFHLEDSHLRNDALLTKQEIDEHRKKNDGFVSLDFIFEQDFKNLFIEKQPEFYQAIKDLSMEEFVDYVMDLREKVDAFTLLKAEFVEAEKSIESKESIYWKELLGVLSFAMNQPAKHFSAEDMLRLKKTLMPLISLVIAYVPQSSCEDLMALHDAGVLNIVSVGDDSEVIPQEDGGVIYQYKDENGKTLDVKYETFIDCVGQVALSYEDFPFKSFSENKTVSQATIEFQSPAEGLKYFDKNPDKVIRINNDYYLKVSGIKINDNFQIIDEEGKSNNEVYMMAVPYISGYNPDYSGLDFCESASQKIVDCILKRIAQ
ncbi:FAD/NAD(P)-binding protein [Pedobacter arcticus]|uniref:FAD/NAD(P)-binding protein n=1 Tax=Pedobacter arcticus TaxID=752140 RepID=UPI0002DA493C|nr:FAD/NAD(P)-binding protein [Pedobacter arcticus]